VIVDSNVPRSGSFGVFIYISRPKGACARTRHKRKGKNYRKRKERTGRRKDRRQIETKDRKSTGAGGHCPSCNFRFQHIVSTRIYPILPLQLSTILEVDILSCPRSTMRDCNHCSSLSARYSRVVFQVFFPGFFSLCSI
jgi:hypothetical protein